MRGGWTSRWPPRRLRRGRRIELVWLSPRSARGVLHLIDDEYDSAAAELRSVAGTSARLGILNTAAFSFAYLARTQWMTGTGTTPW